MVRKGEGPAPRQEMALVGDAAEDCGCKLKVRRHLSTCAGSGTRRLRRYGRLGWRAARQPWPRRRAPGSTSSRCEGLLDSRDMSRRLDALRSATWPA